LKDGFCCTIWLLKIAYYGIVSNKRDSACLLLFVLFFHMQSLLLRTSHHRFLACLHQCVCICRIGDRTFELLYWNILRLGPQLLLINQPLTTLKFNPMPSSSMLSAVRDIAYIMYFGVRLPFSSVIGADSRIHNS